MCHVEVISYSFVLTHKIKKRLFANENFAVEFFDEVVDDRQTIDFIDNMFVQL